ITIRSHNLSTSSVPCDRPTYLRAMHHAINQPIYQLRTMRPIYLPAAYCAISQPIYQLCIMQSTNLSTTCVQNRELNQSIYELYVMQSISTVEADSRVILLLVNLYVQLL